MVNDIKESLALALKELYPDAKVYDEDIPNNFKQPSFMMNIIDYSYKKRLSSVYDVMVSFDVAYFSDKTTDIKSDCLSVQQEIARRFDIVGAYRIRNKKFQIVDDVLHCTFDVNYSEMNEEEFNGINNIITNIGLEE